MNKLNYILTLLIITVNAVTSVDYSDINTIKVIKDKAGNRERINHPEVVNVTYKNFIPVKNVDEKNQ